MKIAVIGATGATGRQVMSQALQRGHSVLAYVRQPQALKSSPGLTIVGGALGDQKNLNNALRGMDVVLCCLGAHSLLGVDVMQRNLPFITQAMQNTGVAHLVLLSGYGVGDSMRSASLLARALAHTLLASVMKDKAIAEAQLERSGVPWTGIYPVVMTDGPLVDAVEVRPLAQVRKVSGLPQVPRANVAKVMLDAVENPASIGQRLLISARGSVK